MCIFKYIINNKRMKYFELQRRIDTPDNSDSTVNIVLSHSLKDWSFFNQNNSIFDNFPHHNL